LTALGSGASVELDYGGADLRAFGGAPRERYGHWRRALLLVRDEVHAELVDPDGLDPFGAGLPTKDADDPQRHLGVVVVHVPADAVHMRGSSARQAAVRSDRDSMSRIRRTVLWS